MPVIYLDTSVIVKRYRTEEGTKYTDALFDIVKARQDLTFASSVLAMIEFIAALRRMRKGGLISEDDFLISLASFREESKEISLQPIDDLILARTVNIIMKHALRSADALHLTTALELRMIMNKVNDKVILASNDNEMCNAAKSEELVFIKPIDENVSELSVIFPQN